MIEGKNNGDNHHTNAGAITSTNGKKTKCQHSFWLHKDDFEFFSQEQKKTLREEPQAPDQKFENWKRNEEKRESHIVKSIVSQVEDSNRITSKITQQHSAGPPGLPSSTVGGQNSQDRRSKGSWNE